jgi:hypothetical protein
MSVVIENFKQDSETTYKFSDKRFTSSEDIKYLKQFTGGRVVFSYETIADKKMIIDIGWPDH